jgi:hypothetical protein
LSGVAILRFPLFALPSELGSLVKHRREVKKRLQKIARTGAWIVHVLAFAVRRAPRRYALGADWCKLRSGAITDGAQAMQSQGKDVACRTES